MTMALDRSVSMENTSTMRILSLAIMGPCMSVWQMLERIRMVVSSLLQLFPHRG